MTTERQLTLMRRPPYDPALDLVVVTAEGVPAAYGMGSVSPEESSLTGRNNCYADLLATHPAYRGHGLARALLVTLLQLLKARGFSTAKLNTSSENGSMQRVATGEGFQLSSKTLRFALSVDSNLRGKCVVIHGSTIDGKPLKFISYILCIGVSAR